MARDYRVFLPGTVCDRVMRKLLEHDDPQPGMMMDWLEEMLHHYAFEDDEGVIRWRGDPRQDYQRVREVCTRVLTNLEPILFAEIIPQGYQSEVKFRQTVGVPYLDGHPVGVDLIGGIDILTMDLATGDYGLWDLKATENDSYVNGAILGQLTFYAIIIKAMFGKFPTKAAFITPACKEKVVPVNITREEIAVMLQRIERYCHGVWRKEWEPKDKLDSDCHYRCDVKHSCDLFALPQGRRVSFSEMADRRRAGRST